MSRYAPHHHPLLVPVVLMLVAIGRLIGCLLPLRNRSGLFFFFPFYHTGGAERVHSQIVSCFKDQQPWIFFAKRSGDARFYRQFSQAGRCFDIGWLLKYSYPLSVGILAGLIGKHPDARVFGCNSLFYYLLLPHLPEHVRATDLLHALGGGAEQFALPVLERLQQRAADLVEHVLKLILVFVLDTILLPLAFLWGLWRLLRGLLGGRTAERVEHFWRQRLTR